MDADLAALPDDIDALKAALMIERAKTREVTAERDVERRSSRWRAPRRQKIWP